MENHNKMSHSTCVEEMKTICDERMEGCLETRHAADQGRKDYRELIFWILGIAIGAALTISGAAAIWAKTTEVDQAVLRARLELDEAVIMQTQKEVKELQAIPEQVRQVIRQELKEIKQ